MNPTIYKHIRVGEFYQSIYASTNTFLVNLNFQSF